MPGMQSRRPLNILLPVIADCIMVWAFSLKSNEKVVRTGLALLAMGVYGYLLIFATLDHPATDYPMGGFLMTRILFVGALFLLPEDAPKLRNDEVKHGINPDSLPFPRRLLRSCSLLCNPRGIGWSHSIPSAVIPKTFPVSRRNFVLYRLLRIFILVLVLDAGFTLQAIHPLLNALAQAENCSKLRMRNQPYSIRCMAIGIFGLTSYAGLMVQSDILSVLFVGSGFSEPRDWPDLCGPPSGCWTVRRFWG